MEINIGQYVIGGGAWGDYIKRVDELTPKLVKTHRYGKRYEQMKKEDVLVVVDDEEAAKQCVTELNATRDLRDVDMKAAQHEYDRVRSQIVAERTEAFKAVVEKWTAV